MSNPVWWINATFSGKHHYVLQAYLYGDVNANCQGTGKLSGLATLDFSSGSNGAYLAYVVY